MTEKLPKGVCREILKMEREDVDMTERAAKARGKDPSLSAALETLYKAHCGRLEEIMRVYGFPTLKNGGAAVVAAAWRVVQHSIENPAFMKRVDTAFKTYAIDEIPLKERAYLEDRIAFYGRRPQRYGTQFDYDLKGRMSVWWLEDAAAAERLRKEAGMPPLEEVKRAYGDYPRVSAEEAKIMRAQQEEWLLRTGWCTAEDVARYYAECGE